MRSTRRWTLPVYLSIFTVSALGLGLAAFIEIVDAQKKEYNAQKKEHERVIYALSMTVVCCSIFVISVVIPGAAVYDFMTTAKR